MLLYWGVLFHPSVCLKIPSRGLGAPPVRRRRFSGGVRVIHALHHNVEGTPEGLHAAYGGNKYARPWQECACCIFVALALKVSELVIVIVITIIINIIITILLDARIACEEALGAIFSTWVKYSGCSCLFLPL